MPKTIPRRGPLDFLITPSDIPAQSTAPTQQHQPSSPPPPPPPTSDPPSIPPPSPSDPHIHHRHPTQPWSYIAYNPALESHYLPAMRDLISHDLSEPYSIYVYYYFLHTWPSLSYLCVSDVGKLLGVIICKLEPHIPPSRAGSDAEAAPMRGYIAMLATHGSVRQRGIGRELVKVAVEAMTRQGADEVVLETELSNEASLRLYRRAGFLRVKRLWRYYLNGGEAVRLVRWVKGEGEENEKEEERRVELSEEEAAGEEVVQRAEDEDGRLTKEEVEYWRGVARKFSREGAG